MRIQFSPFRRFSLTTCAAFLACSLAHGQATVGVQKFGTYDGFPDTVDVGSLGLHLEIPLYRKAGRGNGTAIDISLTNSTLWPHPYFISPDGKTHWLNLGPSVTFGLTAAGSLTGTPFTHQCIASPGSGTYTDTVWTYVDALGNSHLFPGISRGVNNVNNTCSGVGITGYGLTAQASDGSGYLVQVPTAGSPTVTAPSGSIFTFSPSVVQDSNGNILATPCAAITTDSYGNIKYYCSLVQDTVNTSIQMSGGGFSPDGTQRQPLLITYLDDNGNQQTITVSYKVYPYTTNNDAGLVDAITYPDGSAYHFTYLLDANGAVVVPVGGQTYLASLTLPSGGIISYTYPGGVSGSSPTCPAWIPSLTRTTSDGTTTYTRTVTANSSAPCGITASFTNIAKASGDQANIYFVIPQHYAVIPDYNLKRADTGWFLDSGKTMETKRVEYDHSNLSTPIRTTTSCYNGTTGDCTSVVFNEPVTQLVVTTTLDNGQTSKNVTQYTGVSLPTEVDEYDFGASSLTRKTVTSYASLGNNISDRPASVIVYDNAGNTVEKTTYSYDETTPSPMTLPGHTTVSGSRGNPTNVYRWLVSTNQSFRTQYTYDDAGQVTATTDPNGNVTSYNYDTATDAYRTKITRPTTNSVTHVSTFVYGPNSGGVTSAYDENNQLTSYKYDSMFRPSSITYPDGGQTTFSYTPTSRTTNRLQQTGVWVTNIEQTDGYGRTARTQVTSDPDCATGDKTDTTYDVLGRVYTVSNPYCTTNDPTYGLTTYAYDALGRTTQVTHPDNTTVLTTYTGRATRVQDEGNGTQRITRISQTDALGRLLSLCEVAPGPFVGAGGSSSSSLIGSNGTPAACGQDIAGTGFLTTYQYDTLGNLLQVNQPGIAPRTFTYDSLSRLLTASNPESGTICYGTYSAGVCQGNGYDANGNLLTKTAPAPNQTGTATVTTTYQYDALNRLTQKSYNDNGVTPTTSYTFDSFSSGCGTGYYFNTIGRLAYAAVPGWSFCYGYDPMGRLLDKDLTMSVPAGINYLDYTYDLLGNITSQTAGYGTAYYTYNTAGRPITVTSSYSDANNPATIFSAAHYNAFGGLTSNTLGDGETETYTYVPHLTRLQSYTAKLNTSTLYNFNITSFAPNGDVLAANDTANGNWTYAYDPFNRLVGANQNTGQAIYNYVYDRFGNRWQQNGPQTFLATFTGNNPGTPQNNNRMDGYSHDAAGNLLNDGTHSYTYDAENRIIKVDGGNTATYVYDSDGNRVQKTQAAGNYGDPAGTWQFLYDQYGHMIQRFDGTLWQGNVYANSRLLAVQGGGTFFVHSDWLGTVRVRNQYSNPAFIETCLSLPFGDGLSCPTQYFSDFSPLHFTGKERDSESGLDNFGARYDSSSMGRFMSPDPIYIEEQKMLDPQQLNLYSYVRNNPLNLTDSTGMLLDVNCSQVTSDQCKQTVTDFNNRKGAQFQVTRDDKTGQLNVNGDVDPTTLSGGERALYDSITNKDATGTLTVVGNDSSFDFEKSTGKGQNSLDRSDLNALNGADKRLSGEVIAHAALESYDSAKPGVSIDKAHDFASSFFPGFQYNPRNWTPFRDPTTGLVAGASNRFYSSRLDIMFRARTTLVTQIPYVDWSKSRALPPRDVTNATIVPAVQ
jgi:RHS repeat-associated protein